MIKKDLYIYICKYWTLLSHAKNKELFEDFKNNSLL